MTEHTKMVMDEVSNLTPFDFRVGDEVPIYLMLNIFYGKIAIDYFWQYDDGYVWDGEYSRCDMPAPLIHWMAGYDFLFDEKAVLTDKHVSVDGQKADYVFQVYGEPYDNQTGDGVDPDDYVDPDHYDDL